MSTVAPIAIGLPPNIVLGDPTTPLLLATSTSSASFVGNVLLPTVSATTLAYQKHEKYYKEPNRRVSRWEDDYESKY